MNVSKFLKSDLKEGDHIYGLVKDPRMDYMPVGYYELEITSANKRYLKDDTGKFQCCTFTIKVRPVVEVPKSYDHSNNIYLSISTDYCDPKEETDIYLTEKDAYKAVKHYKSLRKRHKTAQKKYDQQMADYQKYITEYQEEIEKFTRRLNDLKVNRTRYLSECDTEPLAFVLKK